MPMLSPCGRPYLTPMLMPMPMPMPMPMLHADAHAHASCRRRCPRPCFMQTLTPMPEVAGSLRCYKTSGMREYLQSQDADFEGAFRRLWDLYKQAAMSDESFHSALSRAHEDHKAQVDADLWQLANPFWRFKVYASCWHQVKHYFKRASLHSGSIRTYYTLKQAIALVHHATVNNVNVLRWVGVGVGVGLGWVGLLYGVGWGWGWGKGWVGLWIGLGLSRALSQADSASRMSRPEMSLPPCVIKQECRSIHPG